MGRFDRPLVNRATYDTDYETVREAGVTEEMIFDPEPKAVLVYGYQHLAEYGCSPTPRIIRAEFPTYELEPVKEPLDYCIARVLKDYKQFQLDNTMDLYQKIVVEERDPDAGLEVWAEAVNTIGRMQVKGKTVDLGSVLRKHRAIWQERARSGRKLIGIPSGFVTIDNATLGFQPSQLITVAGLGGAGKSTLMMRMAREAQKHGYRPYFMSFEMSEEEQVGRYMAMATNIPYTKIVAWQLTARQEEDYLAIEADCEAMGTFSLCTDIARSSTVPGLEGELRKLDTPDVAFIDGVYLMHDHRTKKGGSDWEAMTNITRDMKQLSQRIERPIIMSTQALMSKTKPGKSKTHRRLDMYSPGYSSSFAQDSDVMFALENDEQYPEERIVRVVKARHCASYTVKVEWDWSTASFGDEVEVLEGEAPENEWDDDEA